MSDIYALGRAMREAQRDYTNLRYHPDEKIANAAYEKFRAAEAAFDKALAAPPAAPGMTDLMVTPESIDAFMEANPPPPAAPADVAGLVRKLVLIADASKREDGSDIPLGQQVRAAADAIERLARENEVYKLRIGFDYDKHITDARDEITRQYNRAEAAEARIAALEGALRKLLSCPAIADGNHAEPAYFCAETVAAESEARAALAQKGGEMRHADDLAVDRFAAAMKAKLSKKRAEGRGGWEDKAECSNELLSRLLREHVEKGDPLDVGNLAMMLHQREERIAPPPPAREGE